VLALDATKWIKCSVMRRGPWLEIAQEGIIANGMSGSPIVSMDGRAIGVVSTGIANPVIKESLPARFLRYRRRKSGA
jgi:hypothetical protein